MDSSAFKRCATGTTEAGPESRRQSVKRRTLEQIKEFIETNYPERLTLEDLAMQAQLSVFRFSTIFRQRFGVSPYRFLSIVRVAAAKRLLIEGTPSAIVAIEVGFCDQSHLCRHFRSICGKTPGRFLAERASWGLPAYQKTPASNSYAGAA